jgi:hypothetical protein
MSNMDEVFAVLDGKAFSLRDRARWRRLLFGPGDDELEARNMISDAFTHADGVDLWVRETGVDVRYRHPLVCSRPWEHGGAPAMIWDLMGRLGVERIPDSCVGLLSHPARIGGLPRSNEIDCEMVAWIVRRDDDVLIHLRPLAEREPPKLGPVPESGPWQVPSEPPPWDLELPPMIPKPLYTGDRPLQCPHCGETADRFRRLSGGAAVCPHCHRSHDPDRSLESKRFALEDCLGCRVQDLGEFECPKHGSMWNVAGHMPTRAGHYAIQRDGKDVDAHAHLVDEVLSPTRVRIRHAKHDGFQILVWDEQRRQWVSTFAPGSGWHYVFGAVTNEQLGDG